MPYESQRDAIWRRFLELAQDSRHGAVNVPTLSQFMKDFSDAYRRVDDEGDRGISTDVKSFLAESLVWESYFGKVVPFPGIDPRLASAPSSPSSPSRNRPLMDIRPARNRPSASFLDRSSSQGTPSSTQLQSQPSPRLEEKVLIGKRHYVLQLGWNVEKKEPWLAVRCYAKQAYPNVHGPNRTFISQLHALAPRFLLQYERIPDPTRPVGHHLLMWPQFRDSADLKNSEAWKEFGNFRAFLHHWAGRIEDHRDPICDSYDAWKRDVAFSREFEALPPGFPLPTGGANRAETSRLSISATPASLSQSQVLIPPKRSSNTLAAPRPNNAGRDDGLSDSGRLGVSRSSRYDNFSRDEWSRSRRRSASPSRHDDKSVRRRVAERDPRDSQRVGEGRKWSDFVRELR